MEPTAQIKLLFGHCLFSPPDPAPLSFFSAHALFQIWDPLAGQDSRAHIQFLTTTILIGVIWYLNVVLTCISLMTSDMMSFFSYVCWLHKHLLLRSVCSYRSPTF